VAALLGPAGPPLVAHNPAPGAFAALSKADPGIVDLFVAPTQAVAFVLEAQLLRAIDPRSGAAIWSLPVRHDRVVMVEWATGADIERWAEAAVAAAAP
jgi:hypothetical protein